MYPSWDTVYVAKNEIMMSFWQYYLKFYSEYVTGSLQHILTYSYIMNSIISKYMKIYTAYEILVFLKN